MVLNKITEDMKVVPTNDVETSPHSSMTSVQSGPSNATAGAVGLAVMSDDARSTSEREIYTPRDNLDTIEEEDIPEERLSDDENELDNSNEFTENQTSAHTDSERPRSSVAWKEDDDKETTENATEEIQTEAEDRLAKDETETGSNDYVSQPISDELDVTGSNDEASKPTSEEQNETGSNGDISQPISEEKTEKESNDDISQPIIEEHKELGNSNDMSQLTGYEENKNDTH